jgi:cell division protein FtsQ
VTTPLPDELAQPRGNRRRRIAAVVLLALLLLPASWLAREGASRLEFFHLRAVSVEGTRYLSPDTVVKRLALDTLRSVWDDTEPLAERLRRLPQVTDVEIERRLPGTLVVKIRENVPVALVPSPRGLEAVDTAGRVLPIDPANDETDLPIANQRDARVLALLGEIRSGDAALYSRISEISRDGKGAAVLLLAPIGGIAQGELSSDSTQARGPRSLRVRIPLGVSVSRLADIFPVETDLVRRRANIAELDLRYRDQVIARLQ